MSLTRLPFSTMLRITHVVNTTYRLQLRVEGAVVGAWADELDRVCREALGKGQSVTLDLAAVQFADADGMRLLRAMMADGIRAVGASPMVRDLWISED